jgi:putative ABC transport system permease protein
MLKNYFKIAFRNLIRKKVFSFINIFGLAIGIACTILILLWVQDELSYDNFHKNKDNIYRVLYESDIRSDGIWGTSPGLLAPEAKKVIPEIIDAARMLKRPRMVMKAIGESKNQPAFYEDNYYLVDPSLFKMFTLPFLKGNPETALDNGMVITKSIALKYFGTTDVLGKRLNVNNWFDVTITGVIKDIPENSHFNFDMFTRLEDLKKYFPGGFTWSNAIHQTYVQLAPNSKSEIVVKKLTDLNNENNQIAQRHHIKISLQPLQDIYLDAGVQGTTVKQGDKRYVYIFSIIALLILFIGCINFVNLSTAHTAARARSIGMLKIIGANRSNLIKQIWGESIFLSFLAAFLALLMVEITLPVFNNFTGKDLTLTGNNLSHLFIFFFLVIITGLVAGAFPAIYFSNFKPIQAYRNKWISSSAGGLRKGLVISQFVAAIFLIIVTLVITNQLNFLRNQKLGFKKDNIVCLPVKADVASHYQSFRNELIKQRNINNIGIKNSITTQAINNTTAWWDGKDPNKEFVSEIDEVDCNFINTLGLKVIEGRNFSEKYPTDLSRAFIINEEAAREMELKNPVGTHIKAWDKDGFIIGVVKDANFKSLKEPIRPMIFHLTNNFSDDVMNLFGVIYISIKPDEVPKTLKAIKDTWEKFNPGYPFEYIFLDETYNNLYQSEEKLADIFGTFTSLALFVTFLGLFGLALFMTEQRTKEIGIRKVLGASVIDILSLLSSSFTKWLIIANVIAWPAAWFAMTKWLHSYAYHIDISFLTFFIAGSITLIITLLTISLITIKAAVANPVESLRYE